MQTNEDILNSDIGTKLMIFNKHLSKVISHFRFNSIFIRFNFIKLIFSGLIVLSLYVFTELSLMS